MLKKPKLFQNVQVGCLGNKKKIQFPIMMKFKTETFRRLSPSMCISNKLPFNQNLVHMKALSKLSEATVPGLEGCSKHCWPI